ncbi:hypothetical protein KIN20_037512 [Parelaphostrongylus tenuis]|nr:hypothetical protein KIN20_037512 [Parelaphostrongylus tenuis]
MAALSNMKLDQRKLKMLVIDEVGTMIDQYGLRYGLDQILEKIPGDSTIAGFSAVYCGESNLSFFRQLQMELFRHAVPILINVAAPKGYITQRVSEKGRQLSEYPYWEPDFLKDLDFLVGLINRDLELHHMRRGGKCPYEKSTVIFAKDNKTSNYLAIYLQLMGYHFEPFNSDFIVMDNQETIRRLKRGEIQGIVSSNGLVRAVDISEVDHKNYVIDWETAETWVFEYELRWIGRTGTMGRGGRATVMLSMNAD